ncbi:alpha-L-fucosidase [Sphingobacterium corticibacterium]|uniref:alpha-L-fucosidase n=1 Tax=Sphingobacterium corticibacterium TaxID=2484746 RepID=A0A4Q6XKG8_9SPHI|nr:alpha-L-fucosidase [Sphingobacterium corticibacterium]RZF59895.1 alpha-L-fucosidase [Sphingobacterium corticibacterium]
MIKQLSFIVLCIILCIIGLNSKAQKQYTPDWESLHQHTPVPEWMRDAKFGIYCHWGVYSVPAYGNEQYYFYMHQNSESTDFLMGGHNRHIEMYGPLSEFGYHDFIPMFKGEKFDADEWATLFKESGARFAGTVAEHHDGFSMWDSKYTPFNAKEMGPKRDIIGELGKSIKARGLKFITSLHHENNYTYVKVKPEWAANNPKYAKMYGCLMPHEEWLQMWLNKSNEVVDKYSPDLVYFDAWMDQIPERYKLDFLSNYFNQAQKTKQEVIVTYKNNDFPRTIGMLDHEMFSPDEMDSIPWLCDLTISAGYHRSWGYVKGMKLSTHKEILHKLIEIVSNNGHLLLNLSPMADGSIPQDQKDVMANVGVWLWSYGESIYGTRPYVVSNEITADGKRVHYTRKGKSIYAIFLDWPGTEKQITLSGLSSNNLKGQIKSATLLSVKKNYDCAFQETVGSISFTIPKNGRLPSDVAQVIRFDLM